MSVPRVRFIDEARELIYSLTATVKNNILYIDGGMQTYVPVSNGSQQTGNITIGYSGCHRDLKTCRMRAEPFR